MLFADLLDRGAGIDAQADAFVEGDTSWTFAQVQRFTYRFARRLKDLGYGPGDKGSILSFNSSLGFQCAFGLHRAGLAWIPANPRNSAKDTHYVLDAFDCRILVFHSAFVDMVRALRPRWPKIGVYICLDRELDEFPSLEQWLAGVDDSPVYVDSARDAIAAVTPTGGTTGRSKGVIITQRNLYTMVASYMICFAYRATERPVNMAAAPLTHAAGMLSLPTLARGGKVIILPKPDLGLMLDVIERHAVTEFFLPPTVIYRLLEHPGVESRNFSSVRYFGYGSAPMSMNKLRRAIEVFGPCMTQYFGQSEAPALCTFLGPDEHVSDGAPASDEVLSSCGRPTPMTQLRIVDDDNRVLPPGQIGEVCVHGDLVTPGYYNQPDLTAATIVDGWLHTGDIGFFDPAGRLHLCDRKKDMIITGGLNVYPQEIEQVIWGHPDVQDCAVIGIPDEEWGELVTAVVELNPGAKLSADEIMTLCKTRLGSVKTPKRVDFVPELPRSPNGKVLKRDLRERYWAGSGRQI
jgi:acyl-CoA synthetase (AMP-forming)/AMP-acid ligase II